MTPTNTFANLVLGAALLAAPDALLAGDDSFSRGDVNDDSSVDIADAASGLMFLFGGGDVPSCLDAADVNDDSNVDISDPVRLLGFLFLGSEPPPAPFGACGSDPTPDELSCGANHCSEPGASCADLVAVSVLFEDRGFDRFGPETTLVIGTIRNDGPDPFTAEPGGARAILGRKGGDFWLSVDAEREITELAPGEELVLEAALPPSSETVISATLEIDFGPGPHDADCDPENNETGTAQGNLLGGLILEGDCTPELREFAADIMHYGRTAAISQAFEECIASKMRTLYKGCAGDPFSDGDIETQIAKVLAVARSVNPVGMFCTGADPRSLGQAGIGDYGHAGEETFNWSGWLAGVEDHLDRTCIRPPTSPTSNGCRWNPYPWPYSQAADVVWHEVMHTHGYGHGINYPEEDPSGLGASACGVGSIPGWRFQSNTVPYIVGGCMSDVITLSHQICGGGIDNCPGEHQLRILRSWDNRVTAGCECIHDPGYRGLGIVDASSSGLASGDVLPDGDRAGSWLYSTSNTVHVSGDFDRDGRDEVVITSGWGIGIIEPAGGAWTALVTRPNGTRFGEWSFDSTLNTIRGDGDFNGDGQDDFLVTSDWGIGVLTKSGDSLTSLVAKPNGTRFGAWDFSSATDQLRIGDFNGDGSDDVLAIRDDGIAVLTYFQSSFASIVAAGNGTWFGGWNFSGSANSIWGVGDVDGDGGDDIVIRSAGWIGVLTLEGPELVSLVVKPDGTVFGSWAFDAATDQFRGIADVSGDGRGELIFTSATKGIGVLAYLGDSLFTLFRRPNGSSFGDWTFDASTNVFVGAADIDGNGGDEILLRGPGGYGAFTRSGPTFAPVDAAAFGELFGSWIVQESDWTVGLGDYNGDGARDILFQAHDG